MSWLINPLSPTRKMKAVSPRCPMSPMPLLSPLSPLSPPLRWTLKVMNPVSKMVGSSDPRTLAWAPTFRSGDRSRWSQAQISPRLPWTALARGGQLWVQHFIPFSFFPLFLPNSFRPPPWASSLQPQNWNDIFKLWLASLLANWLTYVQLAIQEIHTDP